ncbi:MAG: hypothetical protein AB7H66_11530 [Hyphomonadaceae bacterium]
MDFNWSALDAVLAIALVIVIIWAAMKLVTRLILGIVIVVVIAVAFFGAHLNDFGIRLGG